LSRGSVAALLRSSGCSFKRGPFPASCYATTADIDPSKLVIEKTKSPKPKTEDSKLVFGHTFTDHMLTAEWNKGKGWETPQIKPFQNLSLSPATVVFHYGMEAFEGMKAYSDAKGNIRLFRPLENMKRLNHSAARLYLPAFDGEKYLECIKQLIRLDKDWVPKTRGCSLYIRPTLLGTQTVLGVGPSEKALLFTILSPVGPYYKTGWKPVKLLADPKYVRAWPGGTGNTKFGGNYAPTIKAQIEAEQRGYQQVLWLFGPDDKVTEVGTMNMFVFWKNKQGEKELVTPPDSADGVILSGVTRKSILQLARSWNEFKVTERDFGMKEFVEAIDEGRMMEAFGSGTAVVVCPVEGLHYKGKDYKIPLDPDSPNAGAGKLARRFAETLFTIQYGEVEHPWSVVI